MRKISFACFVVVLSCVALIASGCGGRGAGGGGHDGAPRAEQEDRRTEIESSEYAGSPDAAERTYEGKAMSGDANSETAAESGDSFSVVPVTRLMDSSDAHAGAKHSDDMDSADAGVVKGEAVGDVPSIRTDYEAKETPLPASGPRPDGTPRGRLAIVIDDLGGGVAGTSEIMNIRAPLTVSILPQGRYAAREANMAAERGYAVLVHQPMEPLDRTKNPGGGALLAGMDADAIRRILSSNVALVPGAIGVSNHMGSRVTQDSAAMRVVLEEVYGRGLFFFDSRTTSDSVVGKVAQGMGIQVLENVRFLDHIDSQDYVIDSIRVVARIAMARGSAAAIGHVRPATARAIQRVLPELAAAGIELVTIDKLAPAAHGMAAAPGKSGTSEKSTAQSEAPRPAAAPASTPPSTPVATPATAPEAQPEAAAPPLLPDAQPAATSLTPAMPTPATASTDQDSVEDPVH
ncbi:MAG: divergent polysaccharide deacetylase family protein [Clostridia bacterium]|nr:divergent polysaccharide deacetylase family protein [Clostridia bacterium]